MIGWSSLASSAVRYGGQAAVAAATGLYLVRSRGRAVVVAGRGPPGHERVGVGRQRNGDRALTGGVAVGEHVTRRGVLADAAGHARPLPVVPVTDELVRRLFAFVGGCPGVHQPEQFLDDL